ncbi:MAG: geranylgeranylglycerol-phosphate geranylgeranyltransferase [Bacteroidota bacterium]
MADGTRKLLAYLELSRPVNVAITFCSIPAASVLAGARSPDWVQVLLAAATGGLVAAGANAVNDSFDVEIDRINRPDRPLPRGALSREEARAFWLITSLIAVGLNLFVNVKALGIVVFAVAVLYYYSAALKRTVFAGNLVVGLLTGMAFIYGAVAVGRFERSLMPATFAFLVNVGRELIKDVEDLEGDRKESAATLPVKYGVKPALVLTTVILVSLIAVTILAYILHLYNQWYLYLVFVIDAALVYVVGSMWRDWKPRNLSRLSLVLKLSMVVGLVAIFVGSL